MYNTLTILVDTTIILNVVCMKKKNFSFKVIESDKLDTDLRWAWEWVGSIFVISSAFSTNNRQPCGVVTHKVLNFEYCDWFQLTVPMPFHPVI